MTTKNTSENQPDNETANKGIDQWNERLDHNLETEKHGDTQADIRAEDYSHEKGSGDQSDQPEGNALVHPEHDSEDNMAKNHPRSKNPEDHLDREE